VSDKDLVITPVLDEQRVNMELMMPALRSLALYFSAACWVFSLSFGMQGLAGSDEICDRGSECDLRFPDE
jgi:hypothetical protein